MRTARSPEWKRPTHFCRSYVQSLEARLVKMEELLRKVRDHETLLDVVLNDV